MCFFSLFFLIVQASRGHAEGPCRGRHPTPQTGNMLHFIPASSFIVCLFGHGLLYFVVSLYLSMMINEIQSISSPYSSLTLHLVLRSSPDFLLLYIVFCSSLLFLVLIVYRECCGGHGYQAQTKRKGHVRGHFCLHCDDQQGQRAYWWGIVYCLYLRALCVYFVCILCVFVYICVYFVSNYVLVVTCVCCW